MNIRVRMAPSPTGFLHIGTARTALYNLLFARKNNGKLILRIEDTDAERSDQKFEQDILENLAWLGIAWDEGPFRQSERGALYEQHLTTLLNAGRAYYCACTKEQLEDERKAMLAAGMAPRYSGTCRGKNIQPGKGTVIRFIMPEKTITFTDMIRGHISFNSALIGDVVIAKDIRTPLYNFAVVVDDEDMKITHVIRGEDGIPNTPKQIALQEALNFKHPHYAHLPLILDESRGKMSKRNAATAVAEYRAAGYLPEALVNFMALLGWHPQDNREIMNCNEITELFDMQRVQKAGAIFSIEKLNWINAQYIKKMDAYALAATLQWEATEQNIKIIDLLKSRAQTLHDFHAHAAFFFHLPDYDPTLLRWKTMTAQEIKTSLEKTAHLIENNQTAEISALAEQEGRGEIFWPLRVALSGLKESPGPMEILAILDKKESLKRIGSALEKLNNVQ